MHLELNVLHLVNSLLLLDIILVIYVYVLVLIISHCVLQRDLIIYEMNVRAFTMDESSGLDTDIRGSYLGLIEKVIIFRSESNTVQ